ncbi:MAG: hypothetical protein ABI216_22130 [Devosia sp.]
MSDQQQRIEEAMKHIREANRKVEVETDRLVTKAVISKYTSVIVWGGAILLGAFAAWLIFG